jgi:hypothetical protein
LFPGVAAWVPSLPLNVKSVQRANSSMGADLGVWESAGLMRGGRWCKGAVGEVERVPGSRARAAVRLGAAGNKGNGGGGVAGRGGAEEAVEGFVAGAGRAAGWLFKAGAGMARRLPGADIAERQLRKLEDTALHEVRKRLDTLDGRVGDMAEGPMRWTANEPEGDEIVEVMAFDPLDDPLRAAMATLLNRSVSETRKGAEDHLFVGVLRQLTPDEARIVAALSDGTTYPLVHVAERGGAIILRNASTVGRAAGVTLPEMTPLYVSRLLAAGVAEAGDEDPDLATQYDILLTENHVRAAEEQAKRVKHLRHTLRMSAYGTRFWRACDPSIQQVPPADRR